MADHFSLCEHFTPKNTFQVFQAQLRLAIATLSIFSTSVGHLIVKITRQNVMGKKLVPPTIGTKFT
jgi:hypothetical protein